MLASQMKPDAKTRLETSDRWSGRATLIIFVGIIIELAALYAFTKNISLSEKLVLSAANGSVALGLVIEYWCIKTAKNASNEIQYELDRNLAVSLAYAAEASARAAEANQRAKEAELALAKIKTPRVLAPAQIERVAEEMRPFSGTQYDLEVSSSEDPEILDLVEYIEMTLEKAGWKQLSWRGRGHLLQRQPGKLMVGANASSLNVLAGIVISGPLPAMPALTHAGIALATVLGSEGVTAMLATVLDERVSRNVGTLHLLIGRRM